MIETHATRRFWMLLLLLFGFAHVLEVSHVLRRARFAENVRSGRAKVGLLLFLFAFIVVVVILVGVTASSTKWESIVCEDIERPLLPFLLRSHCFSAIIDLRFHFRW